MLTRVQQRQLAHRIRPARRQQSLPAGTLQTGADARVTARVVMANPACDVNGRQRCEHALVNRELNHALYAYEELLRARFDEVESVLRNVDELPRGQDFVSHAQKIAGQRLGFELPKALLGGTWITGLDMPALYAHCLFETCRRSVAQAQHDQADWLNGMTIDDSFIAECGYHTLDITPCADGRLQGLLPFILRIAPTSNAVLLKAYAGALFDIEIDVSDWTQRELDQRLNGRLGERYLKIAAYHYSSSAPSSEGCAAHGSREEAARDAAISRLKQLRTGIEQGYGIGLGPDVLLLGIDTDLDAIRVHFPNDQGDSMGSVTVEAAQIYRETLGMDAARARRHIAETLDRTADSTGSSLSAGMRLLISRLLEANLSQIEYVIQHHEGRYERLGHGERFICVGDAIDELQMRNLYYFAHLDTLEEGAACVDVGVHIFEKLNLSRGYPAPVIVHFNYASVIPGARDRAVERCERVMGAVTERYRGRVPEGALKFALCVSDVTGDERLGLVHENVMHTQVQN